MVNKGTVVFPPLSGQLFVFKLKKDCCCRVIYDKLQIVAVMAHLAGSEEPIGKVGFHWLFTSNKFFLLISSFQYKLNFDVLFHDACHVTTINLKIMVTMFCNLEKTGKSKKRSF